MRAIAALALLPAVLSSPAAANEPATPAVAPRIEVAFVVDATGSMGPYISEARQRIAAIADDLRSGTPPPKIRFGLVAYRDRGDAFVTRVDPFTSDVATMRAQLDRTGASGGGDTPEAMLEGLEAALTKLDWSDDAEVLRLIYVVGDAPAKHYDGTPSEAALAAEARRLGIVVHTIACGGGLGEDGEETWDRVARLTEGRTLRLRNPYRRRDHLGAGAAPPSTLSTAVGGTTRAYSSSVGVDYGDAPAITLETLATPAVRDSGLVGAHGRWVRDALAWTDLWAAHTSLTPTAERPPIPAVDFSTHHVLVAGGADAGLTVDEIRGEPGSRAATLRPAAPGTVSFVLVPLTDAGDPR